MVKIARLKDGLVLLELFHGRTLAFKDLAMTCTVSFINYFLQKEKSRATVVVGKHKPVASGEAKKKYVKMYLQMSDYCTVQSAIN